ncbi:MAG: hypothetical protein ABI411_20085 [Tahibacter sp.]
MSSQVTSQEATPFFDSTIRSGYYNLGGADVAHHTYAIVERNGVSYALPCFGSFSVTEGERGNTGVRYPADMWSPWILGSRNQGSALPANLSVALGIAQFNLSPETDWRSADWDEYWRNHPRLNGYSPSCWAGVVYGITGVCHQTCNRILWSSCIGGFFFGPVNWPASLSASYWVYGFHGKASEAIAILATALVVKALLGQKASESDLIASHELARNVMRHHVTHELRDHTDGTAREHEVRGMLQRLPESLQLLDDKAIDHIVARDREFSTKKNQMDNRLYNTTDDRNHTDYADTVNANFRSMLENFRNVMPEATFNHFFPDTPVGTNYTLVDRRLMPPNYVRHREGLDP